MRLLILSLSLMLTGCGIFPQVENIEVGAKNPELTPYFNEYRSTALAHGITAYQIDHISLGYDFNEDFFKDQPNVLGVCHTNGQQSQVYLNPLYWNAYGEVDRKILFFHELSHCLIGRDHLSTFYTTPYYNNDESATSSVHSIPVSIMNVYHISEYMSASDMNVLFDSHYIPELFNLVGVPKIFEVEQPPAPKIMEFSTSEDGCDGHFLHPEVSPSPVPDSTPAPVSN